MAAEMHIWTTGTLIFAEGFLWFLPGVAMTGTFFIFYQQHNWTTVSPFSSTSLCHLSGNFTIPSSPNIVITRPGAFCSLPGNGNLSPLREIQKARTKQPCKVARPDEYWGQVTTGQPGWEHVGLVTKGKQHSHLIQKLPCLLLTNCWLSLEWCFQLVW